MHYNKKKLKKKRRKSHRANFNFFLEIPRKQSSGNRQIVYVVTKWGLISERKEYNVSYNPLCFRSIQSLAGAARTRPWYTETKISSVSRLHGNVSNSGQGCVRSNCWPPSRQSCLPLPNVSTGLQRSHHSSPALHHLQRSASLLHRIRLPRRLFCGPYCCSYWRYSRKKIDGDSIWGHVFFYWYSYDAGTSGCR